MYEFSGRGRGDGRSGGRGGRTGGGGGGRDSSSGGRGFDRGGGGGGRGPPGGRDSGRGGGGGGGGGAGRGGPSHMGQVPSVMAALTAAGCTDRDLLAVLNPPAADRAARQGAVTGALSQFPQPVGWRYDTPVGKQLELSKYPVRTNAFRVNPNSFPASLYHYHVHMYHCSREGPASSTDCVADEDISTNCRVLHQLRTNHAEWNAIGGAEVGIVYDGRSALYTTQRLPFMAVNAEGSQHHEEVTTIAGPGTPRFKVTLTLVQSMSLAEARDPTFWGRADATVVNALDTALFSAARSEAHLNKPNWIVVNQKLFSSNAQSFPLSAGVVGMRGYHASLRASKAGLILVRDMAVSCFLTGGDMIDVMSQAAGYRSRADFVKQCERGISRRDSEAIEGVVKGIHASTKHLKHGRKKVKGLGPAPSDRASEFEFEGKKITVSEYYMAMCKTNAAYASALPKKRLEYPTLPAINVGSKSRPVLIPPELLVVPSGISRQGLNTPDIVSQLIRIAAVKPSERFEFITQDARSGGFDVAHADLTAFGLSSIDLSPMPLGCSLLPPAKLRYGGAQEIDPGLAGSWNMNSTTKFLRPPPDPSRDGTISYGVLLVSDREPQGWQDPLKALIADLEKTARAAGLNLKAGGPPLVSPDSTTQLAAKFKFFFDQNVRVVIVPLMSDCYERVKLIADRQGVLTQCLRWRNVDRPPRGYTGNVIIKLNAKLGGVNHSLASRLPRGAPASMGGFQDPPASLGWCFDRPCMLVGVDVTHGETAASESTAAVVASMNASATQFACYMARQPNKMEIVTSMEDAMVQLMGAFRRRNGNRMPEHVIVYRDGVGEGMFADVVTKEVVAMKKAVTLLGYMDDSVKFSVIVCQKRHHSRFVMEDTSSGGGYLNPCPGLVTDGRVAESITSPAFLEFYLNSHVAIQGTCKPCRYTVLYDEIGLKLSEIELMTYWTTYLYSRCNRSVSLATPAYYAHWATMRSKHLSAAGATREDIRQISDLWMDKNASMFFI